MGNRPRAYTTAIQTQTSPGHYTEVPDSTDYAEALADATPEEVARDALQLYIHDGDDLTGPRNPEPLRALAWDADLSDAPTLRIDADAVAVVYPRNVFTWLVQVSDDGHHWAAEADKATGIEQSDGTAKELGHRILQVRLGGLVTTTDAAGRPMTPAPGRLRVLVWEGGLRGEDAEATAVYAN